MQVLSFKFARFSANVKRIGVKNEGDALMAGGGVGEMTGEMSRFLLLMQIIAR